MEITFYVNNDKSYGIIWGIYYMWLHSIYNSDYHINVLRICSLYNMQ